ncbi:MAG: cysteine peptidase family C39 domain-containing protein [Candidatus Moraniibacteriota bacterium]
MNLKLNVKPFQETLNAGYCGPASLKIVLGYYGLDVSEEELAQKTGATKDLGTTAENLKRAAEAFGFQVEIHDNCELQDIEKWLEKKVPIIVDWFTAGRSDYEPDIASVDGHYSVVSGIDDTHIYLQDPELGTERKMQREVFNRVWFDFLGELIKPDELVIRQLVAVYR